MEKAGKKSAGVCGSAGATAGCRCGQKLAQTAGLFPDAGADRIFDVGVAGPYRLPGPEERLDRPNCIVAVAGMGRRPGHGDQQAW